MDFQLAADMSSKWFRVSFVDGIRETKLESTG